MPTTYKTVDVKRGVYEETKTEPKKQEISIEHIRKMIARCEQKKIDNENAIDAEIAYWEAKETEIKKVSGFKEPTLKPGDPDPEPE